MLFKPRLMESAPLALLNALALEIRAADGQTDLEPGTASQPPRQAKACRVLKTVPQQVPIAICCPPESQIPSSPFARPLW